MNNKPSGSGKHISVISRIKFNATCRPTHTTNTINKRRTNTIDALNKRIPKSTESSSNIKSIIGGNEYRIKLFTEFSVSNDGFSAAFAFIDDTFKIPLIFSKIYKKKKENLQSIIFHN